MITRNVYSTATRGALSRHNMAINWPVVCLQYIPILYYPMTDGRIIFRDIELLPPHSVTVSNVLYALFIHGMLHYILLFRISFGFSGSDEYQDSALCCKQLCI